MVVSQSPMVAGSGGEVDGSAVVWFSNGDSGLALLVLVFRPVISVITPAGCG